MTMEEEIRRELLKSVYEQHWLHCRHVESERAWFMNVYAIITGGIITYAFTTETIGLWPIYFLMAFTVIGLLLTFRWMHAFQYHQRKVEETAAALGVPVDLNIPANWFWKVFRTRYLFPSFYTIVFAGLIILLVTNSGQAS